MTPTWRSGLNIVLYQKRSTTGYGSVMYWLVSVLTFHVSSPIRGRQSLLSRSGANRQVCLVLYALSWEYAHLKNKDPLLVLERIWITYATALRSVDLWLRLADRLAQVDQLSSVTSAWGVLRLGSRCSQAWIPVHWYLWHITGAELRKVDVVGFGGLACR